jgi:hypothetical protein
VRERGGEEGNKRREGKYLLEFILLFFSKVAARFNNKHKHLRRTLFWNGKSLISLRRASKSSLKSISKEKGEREGEGGREKRRRKNMEKETARESEERKGESEGKERKSEKGKHTCVFFGKQ